VELIKKGIYICIAYISYLAFFTQAPIIFIPLQHFGGAIFIIAVSYLYIKYNLFKIKKAELIFSLLLSIFYYIGISFSRYDSFALFTASPLYALYSIIILFGFFCFFYGCVCFITEKILLLKIKINNKKIKYDNFLFIFIFLIIAWLPYLFIYFPGTLINDTVRQLAQFMSITPYINHHPIISTFFMGALYRLGLVFDSAVLGLALITLAHNIMMAAVFSLALFYLRKWGVMGNVRIVVLLFFAFFPVYGIWAQTLLKDTHAAAVMLLFALFYIDIIREPSRRGWVLCALAAMLASLLRNEVVYVVVPSILMLVFITSGKKTRITVVGTAVAVFITVRVIISGAMALTDAAPGSVGEVLSIPFQQTARFVRDHEITEAERAVLSATFNHYEQLGEIYLPRISDPVKSRLMEGADLNAYFRVWAGMGLRAPLTYLEAAIAVSFSYVVPFGPDWQIVWPEASYNAIPVLGRDDINQIFSNRTMRMLPARGIEFIERLPIVGLFFHTGNYTWMMAFFIMLLAKRGERRSFLYFIPAMMIILACMASPVHGYWRYYLPILFMFPVLASLTFTHVVKGKEFND